MQTASFVAGLPAESQQDTGQLIVHREPEAQAGEWKGAVLTHRIGISQLETFVPLSTQTVSAKGQRTHRACLVGGFASQVPEGVAENILLP